MTTGHVVEKGVDVKRYLKSFTFENSITEEVWTTDLNQAKIFDVKGDSAYFANDDAFGCDGEERFIAVKRSSGLTSIQG